MNTFAADPVLEVFGVGVALTVDVEPGVPNDLQVVADVSTELGGFLVFELKVEFPADPAQHREQPSHRHRFHGYSRSRTEPGSALINSGLRRIGGSKGFFSIEKTPGLTTTTTATGKKALSARTWRAVAIRRKT